MLPSILENIFDCILSDFLNMISIVHKNMSVKFYLLQILLSMCRFLYDIFMSAESFRLFINSKYNIQYQPSIWNMKQLVPVVL